MQAAYAEDGRFLGADVLELVEEARGRQFVQKLQGHVVLDKLFRGWADAEVIALLEAHGAQTARGILHEAQGVQNPDHAVPDVLLAAEEVDDLAHGLAVEPYGQGVDGEVAAVEIHLDAGVLHRGQGRRRLIVLEAGRGHVHTLLLSAGSGEDDHAGEEFFVHAHAAAEDAGEGPGEADAVAFHHKVDVVVGRFQKQVAHEAAHDVDRRLPAAAESSCLFQNVEDVLRQAVAHGPAHVPGLRRAVCRVHAAGFLGEDIDEVRA